MAQERVTAPLKSEERPRRARDPESAALRTAGGQPALYFIDQKVTVAFT
jgi:hypothetical protein